MVSAISERLPKWAGILCNFYVSHFKGQIDVGYRGKRQALSILRAQSCMFMTLVYLADKSTIRWGAMH